MFQKTRPEEHVEVSPIALVTLQDADQALRFLATHPQSREILEEGNAILSDPKRHKLLLKKVDLTIAPLLAAIYFLNFLDKTTLQYTAVMGLRTDLNLKKDQYSLVVMVYYIGVLAAEFPTQYLAQKISRLAFYLGINLVLWGVVLASHAACTDFTGLIICRTLLGVFESCVAPINIFIIAMWYKQSEQARRISWYQVCSAVALVFGGLVSYGITYTHGSFASWRIFFLFIGGITIITGVIVLLYLPDSPMTAKGFTDGEKAAVLLRIKANHSGTQNAHIKKSQVFETFKDGRVWLICAGGLLCSIPSGGLTNLAAILFTTFGFTNRQALALATIPGAFAFVSVMLVGYFSDRWNDRSTVMLLAIFPTIIGASLLIGLFEPHHHGAHKIGLMIAGMLCGTFSAAFLILMAWCASNIGGHTKKMTVNAMLQVAFSLGSILGSLSFSNRQAPSYNGGKTTVVTTLSALCILVITLRIYNDTLNKQKEKVLERMEELEKEELQTSLAFADITDRENLFFKYTH